MVLSVSQVSDDEEKYDAFLMHMSWDGGSRAYPPGEPKLSSFTPNSIEVRCCHAVCADQLLPLYSCLLML